MTWRRYLFIFPARTRYLLTLKNTGVGELKQKKLNEEKKK
ncbi:hypothetical protein MmTuc01_3117 [Methanosarcina mazei Tuc01]|uniref:Uncharacterized protein n=1 Tax=Methanosarcina mazei Tuc01 TaxID=1236903 RepID=M1QMX8_METMZ|nr:hypothetical protein MmTuc01_3117 [Methanosarcina mazei Tuc01]